VAKQILIQSLQVRRLCFGHSPKGGLMKDTEPVVNVTHLWRPVLLVVGYEASVNKLYIALVPTTVVVKNRHQRLLAALLECALHGAIITGKIGIAIENKKGPA